MALGPNSTLLHGDGARPHFFCDSPWGWGPTSNFLSLRWQHAHIFCVTICVPVHLANFDGVFVADAIANPITDAIANPITDAVADAITDINPNTNPNTHADANTKSHNKADLHKYSFSNPNTHADALSNCPNLADAIPDQCN